LKVSTGFEIENVLRDSTRLLWALDCWGLDIDGKLVRFRIEPRDFWGTICTRGIERIFAFNGLALWNVGALVRYLRENIPALEPIVVGDLRGDDADFKESANKRFRAAFEKQFFHGAA
jgi:hypothetical protein